MRMSVLLVPTLREMPADAEIASHRLMLRAGLIRRVAAGIYTFLPLGLRAVRKVEDIIREEMNREGSQELLLPIVQPAELWQETGRWAEYGPEMWKVADRHDRRFCLGPTHEEIITDLVRAEVSSYRQLPLLLYQIQNKYRDEVRPRFGVMRAREFIMKDLYSFDRDEKGMEESYRKMYDAYSRVFSRCGLDFITVEADPGAIGGSGTHEFMALADYGEALIIYCTDCGYAANAEKAEAAPDSAEGAREDAKTAGEPRKVATPGIRTIDELTSFLGEESRRTLKTLFYWGVFDGGREELVAVVLRGDRQLNEIKLKNYLGALHVVPARSEEVMERTGVPLGFAGPVGLEGTRLVVDEEASMVGGAAAGANVEGYHLLDVRFGRDYKGPTVDLRLVEAGDLCLRCGGTLKARRGIEVGQVFKLWTDYSVKLGATFQDEDGREKHIYMGCYGIGVTRTVAAIIEQHHDEKGIVWPRSVAPYEVIVVPVNTRDGQQWDAAKTLYQELKARGVETVLDDRDERPGVKFNDAELIGFPVRATIGPKSLARGKIELMVRSTGEQLEVESGEAAARVEAILHGL